MVYTKLNNSLLLTEQNFIWSYYDNTTVKYIMLGSQDTDELQWK
jgi:hypothetical protein